MSRYSRYLTTAIMVCLVAAIPGARGAQASDWMWTLLMDDLKEVFLRDRNVAGLLDQVQETVADGTTTPSAASRRLLEAFKRN